MPYTRILFAYDGSECADAALDDLQNAGLPDDAECVVLTIADVWLPAKEGGDNESTVGNLDPLALARAQVMHKKAEAQLQMAGLIAKKGAKRVESIFPGWKVSDEAAADSPGWGIIDKANSWNADLVVLGAHGMSAVERVLIGSVSRKVLHHALCSVRIARSPNVVDQDSPPHLVIGFDGSLDAEIAIQEVANRVWPQHTQARVVTVVDDTLRTAIAARILRWDEWVKAEHAGDDLAWLSKLTERAAEPLRRAGLEVECSINEGEPRRVLLDEARRWNAQCIFVGATGLRGLRRLLIGSVSSGVANSASCTVEVVRRRTAAVT